MILQTYPSPAKASVSQANPVPVDVLWGKPVFRPPELPAQMKIPAEILFVANRITGVRRPAKQG